MHMYVSKSKSKGGCTDLVVALLSLLNDRSKRQWTLTMMLRQEPRQDRCRRSRVDAAMSCRWNGSGDVLLFQGGPDRKFEGLVKLVSRLQAHRGLVQGLHRARIGTVRQTTVH